MTKFYAQLPCGDEFICVAKTSTAAIAKLWQLGNRGRPATVMAGYWIHQGQATDAEFVWADEIVAFLTPTWTALLMNRVLKNDPCNFDEFRDRVAQIKRDYIAEHGHGSIPTKPFMN